MSNEGRSADARLSKLLQRAQRLQRGHSRMSARKLVQTQHKIAYLQNAIAAERFALATANVG